MPERINRLLTDHVSDALLAPTLVAVENLRREGVPSERVHLVGDVMLDAALYYGSGAEDGSRIVDALELTRRNYVLATIHRAEITDHPERLRAIFGALVRVSADLPVVVPIHPRTRKMLGAAGVDPSAFPPGLRLLDPVGYLDMVRLGRDARLIVTDSGGVQKEAYFHRVPCVMLRDETEWTELVEIAWNSLVPPATTETVHSGITGSLDSRGREASPYGDGRAAELIVDALAGAD